MQFEVACRGTAEVNATLLIEADSRDEAEAIARSMEKDWEILTVINIEYFSV